nr:hypothetical protein [Chloroflexia bacterium]
GVIAAVALTLYLLSGAVATSQNTGGTPEASPVATPGLDAPRITLDFTELNDSGVTGTATLYAAGERTIVELALEDTGEDHPAHIHAGTCDDIEPEPEYNLQNIGESGTGTSLVDAPLDDLIDGDYVIDLHLAVNQLGTLIVCTDIEGTPANAAGTPVAVGGLGEPTAQPVQPTSAPTATVAPEPTVTAVPTIAPTTVPTAAPVVTAEPTQIAVATQEATTAPASPEDDAGDGVGGQGIDVTSTDGDGTQGSTSMLDSGKGATVDTSSGVGGGAFTSGDGTEGGATTQSGKGGAVTTTTALSSTGTGSSLIFPESTYEATITASGVFAVILFGAAMLLRQGERRSATGRWRRLGL